MVCHRKKLIHSSTAWTAALLGLVLASAVSGSEIGCLPPTPGPCAADGICRPNRESFGYNQTRWRPWPGDPQPKKPTLADEQAEDVEMELDPFERPPAEKEGNRAPTKTKALEAGTAESEESEPVESLLPNLDDQGSHRAMPLPDDAPPPLPESLRKFAIANRIGHLAQSKPTPPAVNAATIVSDIEGSRISPRRSALEQSTRTNLQPPEPITAIMQVAAEQHISYSTDRDPDLGLVNPAAVGIERGAQQAVYFEASDSPPAVQPQ